MPNIDIPMGDKKIAELLASTTSETGAALSNAFTAKSLSDEAISTSRTSALLPWHTAVAKRDFSKANAVFLGTSMTEGGPAVTNRDRRWVDKLQRNLRSRYPLNLQPVGSVGYIPAFYQTFTSGGTSQYGLVTPTGVTYSGDHLEAGAGLGNRTIELDSSGDWIQFTFTGTGADVFLNSRQTANSTATISVDGAAGTAANMPAGTLATTIHQIRNLTAGEHTVRVTWGSGQVDVDGIYPYNGDETKGIHIYEGGKGSAQAANFTSTATHRVMALIQPSLVGFEFGYNEFFGNISLSTFKTNLQTAVTNALANVTTPPTTLFIIWQQPNDASPATASYTEYMNVIKEVAAATPNSVVVDFRTRFPAYTSNSLGLWGPDQVHHSDTGAAYVADVLTTTTAP